MLGKVSPAALLVQGCNAIETRLPGFVAGRISCRMAANHPCFAVQELRADALSSADVWKHHAYIPRGSLLSLAQHLQTCSSCELSNASAYY